VALVVLFWLGGMTCVETARRAASRQKQLQMEPRGLLALGISRQLQSICIFRQYGSADYI